MARKVWTECTEVVWCETVCGVHDNDPDPYDYNDRDENGDLIPCPGPHRKLYLMAEPGEGEF